MRAAAPPGLELVLLGGGHSHVQVLRSLGMSALAGARVTLISRELLTPYSGMLPGHVAGRYTSRDIHIDLAPLARFAGARLIRGEAVRLDPEQRRIDLDDHPPVYYDLLSINTGATPQPAPGPGVRVKPIGRFLPAWEALRSTARSGDRIVLVGGGAGGVELALAMAASLPAGVELTLVSQTLLPGQNATALARLRAALTAAGVAVHEDFRVDRAERQANDAIVVCGADREFACDHLFWVTGVQAPDWVRESGLATDADGFVQVDGALRSISHRGVFAAGDVASLVGQPRPKAGVYAVREGPVLTTNLRRAVRGRRLRSYRAQQRFLTIIGTGDGRAVAARGSLAVAGRWVWWWKDRIDRRFMDRFQRLPRMPQAPEPAPGVPGGMRCGGCGAKLGADPLRRVLARLPEQRALQTRAQVELGIGDDAALLRWPESPLLLTVDGFRSMVDDAYLFGRIAAHHSLNDILAMGGRGVAALAAATVPLMAEGMMEEELYLLLAGAVAVLHEHDVPLVGGHSAEAAELSLSLTIAGRLDGAALTKGTMRPGDGLLITKALGTGAILAADMRARAGTEALLAALTSMDRSNAPAVAVLRSHGVRALTDVSGFGLLGHLAEMLDAGSVGATLWPARVPLLPGAEALVTEGLVSSLQASNERVLRRFGAAADSARNRLLVDPQTAGGLLAALPAAAMQDCLRDLEAAGYLAAAHIGEITSATARLADPPD